MHEKEEVKEPILNITDNVTGFKKYGLFNIRNAIEGAIGAGITYLIIKQIPFVPKVQIIVTLCVCATVFLINIKGIKNQSFTEVLINTIRESMEDKEYHMRCINESSKDISKEGQNYGQSIADKAIIWIKGVYTHYQKTGEIKLK